MVIGKTEQSKVWVLPRLNRPKYEYRPDRLDHNCHWPNGGRDPNVFFSDHWVGL